MAKQKAKQAADQATSTEVAKTETTPKFMIDNGVDADGVVQYKPEFKYMKGTPREYKSDAKEGNFLINGKSIGEQLTFQPIAWRFFEEDLFALGLRRWAELFFIDSNNAVSAILFHGFSVDALKELAAPLFYEDKTLADVVITATWTHLQNTKVAGKPTFCVAAFEYEEADPEKTAYLQEYASQAKIYRNATLKAETEHEAVHNFYNPYSDAMQSLEA